MSNAAPSPLHEVEILSSQQIVLVRAHLERILNSRTLAGSRRTQDFLKLIVMHALEGEIDSLRERMIGAELFGRPVGYDTGNDSVVRVRASEVRRKLAQYYGAEARNHDLAVRIELPSGSYVPRFHFGPPGAPPASIEPAGGLPGSASSLPELPAMETPAGQDPASDQRPA